MSERNADNEQPRRGALIAPSPLPDGGCKRLTSVCSSWPRFVLTPKVGQLNTRHRSGFLIFNWSQTFNCNNSSAVVVFNIFCNSILQFAYINEPYQDKNIS